MKKISSDKRPEASSGGRSLPAAASVFAGLPNKSVLQDFAEPDRHPVCDRDDRVPSEVSCHDFFLCKTVVSVVGQNV